MTQTISVDNDPKVKFWLGRLVVTTNADAEIDPEDIDSAINRHWRGDWGELCAEDKDANEQALQFGGRLFSAYHDRKGVKFWIAEGESEAHRYCKLEIYKALLQTPGVTDAAMERPLGSNRPTGALILNSLYKNSVFRNSKIFPSRLCSPGKR